MNNKYVASLELCKYLKQLGIKQESYFWYGRVLNADHYSLIASEYTTDNQIGTARGNLHFRYDSQRYDACDIYDRVSAFSVGELGDMIPHCILIETNPITNIKGLFDLQIIKSNVWRFYYGEKICFTASSYATEANARSEFLIYLIENKLWIENNKGEQQ